MWLLVHHFCTWLTILKFLLNFIQQLRNLIQTPLFINPTQRNVLLQPIPQLHINPISIKIKWYRCRQIENILINMFVFDDACQKCNCCWESEVAYLIAVCVQKLEDWEDELVGVCELVQPVFVVSGVLAGDGLVGWEEIFWDSEYNLRTLIGVFVLDTYYFLHKLWIITNLHRHNQRYTNLDD